MNYNLIPLNVGLIDSLTVYLPSELKKNRITIFVLFYELLL
jgi:hypothetical protein